MCDGHSSGGFGCLKCTDSILGRKHGWIECKSISFPGKVYYFHTLTGCSTWNRPVSRHTQLPRYEKYRDYKPFESPTEDEDKFLPSSLGVSGTDISFKSTDVPPSDFELHARRMQIYLQNNTSYNLAVKYGGEEVIRDKLLELYKTAKSELAKKLKLKKTQKKTAKVISNVKPKTIRPKDPVKTVRECHGIKTVSYDPIPRELPNGINMHALSETSDDSFIPKQKQGFEPPIICKKNLPRSKSQAEILVDQNYNFGRFVIKDLNLSESETTTTGTDILNL